MKNQAQLNDTVKSTFHVIDSLGNVISGLSQGDFTRYIYGPDDTDITATTTDGITEIGNGLYRHYFIPTVEGMYSTDISHASYRIFQTSRNFEVTQDRDWKQRTLGLVQENIYYDQFSYIGTKNTSMRMRIYSDPSSVGSSNNVIGTYTVTTEFSSTSNNPTSFQITKV